MKLFLMREAFRKFGPLSAALILGVCLAILGAKFWLIQKYGSDLPFGDQWDAEAAQLTIPSAAAHLHFGDLFQPREGNRLVFTRILALVLLKLNGQWDARLQMVVNAVLHSIALAILLFALRRQRPESWIFPVALLSAVLFGLPFSWVNTLNGFHSDTYFLELFSFLHLGGTFLAPPGSRRRWWAQGAGLCGLFSAAAGIFSAVVLVAIVGAMAVRQRKIFRSDLVLLGCNLVFVVFGLALRSDLPVHYAFGSHSFADFCNSLFLFAAWPSPYPALFFLNLVPFAVVGIWRLRQENLGPPVDFVLGLGGWWMLQCVSSAFCRGGDGYAETSRYFDLFAVGVIAAFALWIELFQSFRGRRFIHASVIGLIGAWLVVVAHGLWFQTAFARRAFLDSMVAENNARSDAITDFVATGNPRFYQARVGFKLPYAEPEKLAKLLGDPSLRAILPSSIRAALPTICEQTGSSGFAKATAETTQGFLSGRSGWTSAERPSTESAHFQSAFIAPPQSYFLRFWVKGTFSLPSGSLYLETASERIPVEVPLGTESEWKSAIVVSPNLPFRLMATSLPGAALAFTNPVELPLGSWFARQVVKLGPTLLSLGSITLVGAFSFLVATRVSAFRLRLANVQQTVRDHPGIVTLAVAAAILLFRKTDVWLRPQFWAEDGPVFFEQAAQAGSSVIFAPYAGYLHFLPRWIALFATHFDVRWAPTFYVYASIAFTLVVVAIVFSDRLSFPCKPLIALAIVSVPHTGEVFLNLTNLQWVTALGLVLIALKSETPNTWAIAGDCLVVVVFGLTGPFVLVLFPLYIFRAALARSRASVLLLLAALLTACIQGEALLSASPAIGGEVPNLWQSIEIVGFRAFGKLLLGGPVANWLGVPTAASLGWVGGLGLAWLSWRNVEHKRISALLWAAFVLLVCATIMRFGGSGDVLFHTQLGDRYFYIPLVILVWLLVCALRPWPRIGAIIGLLIIVANFAEFRFPPYQDFQWEKTSQHIAAGETVHVVVNPGFMSFDHSPLQNYDYAGSRGRFGESGLAYLAIWTALLPIGLALWVLVGRRLDFFRPWGVLVVGASICLLGYGIFWAYFVLPAFGAFLAWSLWGASIVVIMACRRELAERITVNSPACDAIVLSFFIGLAYLAVLYYHGSSISVDELAANRFLNGLQVDNQIPRMFAERLIDGKSPRMLIGDWLSSDRPPLQTGLILLASTLGRFFGLALSPLAHCAGLWFQLLWVPALGAFSIQVGLTRARAALLVMVAGMIGFFVLQSLYVWPKLGGGAMAFAAFCIWFRHGRTTLLDGLVAGVLSTLAWLAHGGIAFSFLALAILGVLTIRRTSWSHVLVGALAFGVITAPWLAYQKYYDPPGNRLLKMHLAGVTPIDQRSTGETIVDSYRNTSWQKVWKNKRNNLQTTLMGNFSDIFDFALDGAESRRVSQFFYVFLTLWQWNVGWLLLPWLTWKYWRTKDLAFRLVLLCACWSALTYLDWIILMFGGTNVTIVHQSSYAMHLSWFALLLVTVLLWNRWLFYALAAMQALVLATTWLPASANVSGPILPSAGLTLLGVVAALALYRWRYLGTDRASYPSVSPPQRLAEP